MNTSIIGQAMAYEATQVPRNIIKKQVNVWESRRDVIYQGMIDLELDLWKPEGAFYVFPKFKNPNKVMHDLYYKYKMITYDGTWFGDATRLRLSYALDEEKIKEGLRRLKTFLSKEYSQY
jgi:aspartate/methionine/tyrosine aminotransferase